MKNGTCLHLESCNICNLLRCRIIFLKVRFQKTNKKRKKTKICRMILISPVKTKNRTILGKFSYRTFIAAQKYIFINSDLKA